MQKKKLGYQAQQLAAPEGIDAIDSIMIHPRSSGKLNAGEYSKTKKPNIHIHISATNEESVVYEEKLLGDEEHYTLVYDIQNYNDSPAFVYITAWDKTSKFPCPLCKEKTPRSYMKRTHNDMFHCEQCGNEMSEPVRQ